MEDQATADERIPFLLQAPAAVRFISLEPQLEHVDLRPFLLRHPGGPLDPEAAYGLLSTGGQGLDWVIQGGESGPRARGFSLGWADNVREQCHAAGVAYFFKQAGSLPFVPPKEDGGTGYYLDLKSRKGGDLSELDERFRVREFPRVGA